MIKNYSFFINKTNYSFSTSLNKALSSYFTFSTSSKQKIKINNTIVYDMEAIYWFSLNKNGFIIPTSHVSHESQYQNYLKELKNRPGIYIYQYLLDKNIIYIGSSINVVKRLVQHRYSSNKGIKSCPKFYYYVNEYGWSNFRVGILEYMDLSKDQSRTIKVILRRSLLEREQFYFDILKPTLNVKRAVSTLGFKHTKKVRFVLV